MTGHVYLSTACWHGLHDRCRQLCKFCSAPCYCNCHDQERREAVTIPRPDQRHVTVHTEGQPE